MSEHSPGRVEDPETLVRILVAPQHMDRKTGLPKPAALTHAETIGLSVFRDERATNEEIRSVAEGLVARARASQNEAKAKKIGVFGVLRMSCNTIRAFLGPAERDPCYCVYDTATAPLRSHADAFQRISGVADGVPDARRTALFDLVKPGFVPVDHFRDGLLKDLAPEA